MKTLFHLRHLMLAATCVAASHAALAENIRIAFIDPLSGPFGAAGTNSIRSLQYAAEVVARQKLGGDHTIEIVGFDNKGSPQESVNLVKAAIDQGIRFVTSGGSSGATLAMMDAITKHNERNPGKEMLMLNYGSVDPDLTNAKCSFWHFRYDAHIGMKVEAMTSEIAKNTKIRKVYLFGQNYVSGIQFNKYAAELLKKKRPDIEIVGDDLHPIGQVKDFAPYIAKIKASGADTVLTGNWGMDLVLLIKSAKDAGLNVDFYTYYAALRGTPEAMGASGENRVKYGAVWHPNVEGALSEQIAPGFRKKYNEDFYMANTYALVASVAQAARKSGSVDPTKIARALEGMEFESLNGKVVMRKQDHQLQQPFYIATWAKADGKTVRYDQEGTGFGWKTDVKVDPGVAEQPSTCHMRRPD